MTKSQIRKYIAERYGFYYTKIQLLEVDTNDPLNYATFSVMGIEYQVRKGELSICNQES